MKYRKRQGGELRTEQEVEKEWGEWGNVSSADEVDPLIGLRLN